MDRITAMRAYNLAHTNWEIELNKVLVDCETEDQRKQAKSRFIVANEEQYRELQDLFLAYQEESINHGDTEISTHNDTFATVATACSSLAESFATMATNGGLPTADFTADEITEKAGA